MVEGAEEHNSETGLPEPAQKPEPGNPMHIRHRIRLVADGKIIVAAVVKLCERGQSSGRGLAPLGNYFASQNVQPGQS